jgi:hypothetical protein
MIHRLVAPLFTCRPARPQPSVCSLLTLLRVLCTACIKWTLEGEIVSVFLSRLNSRTSWWILMTICFRVRSGLYAYTDFRKDRYSRNVLWRIWPLLGNNSVNTSPQHTTRNNRTSMQRFGKQALSKTQAVFSMWCVPRLYNEVPRITESSVVAVQNSSRKRIGSSLRNW